MPLFQEEQTFYRTHTSFTYDVIEIGYSGSWDVHLSLPFSSQNSPEYATNLQTTIHFE